ncbi:MAG: ATP-binding protein [Anaerolineales bacterium]|nr:MAG: ATP-binding protein [Anaerolineales bacterium]
MTDLWNQQAVQQYIDIEIQESLVLEYKAAEALGKSDGKMREITKDVSAMANSSGGRIIYGVKEYGSPDKKHLPEKIDPIEQDKISKEWLEQVINNIRPRIDGLLIYPIQLDSALNHVAYVVEIPQSTTAHQATDWRYYKRFNFQAVPMEDYEIRDTMGRKQYPKIGLDFKIELATKRYFSQFENKQHIETSCVLKVTARNTGGIYAQFVNTFISIPLPLLHELTIEQIKHENEEMIVEEGQKYYEYYEDNTVRDVVDVESNIYLSIPKYGPSRYDPILPGLSRTWEIILRGDFEKVDLDGLLIKWSTHVDNAPVSEGQVAVSDIRIIDDRNA